MNKDLNKRKEELQAELARVEKEIKVINNLSPVERIADLIHGLTCKWNHTDGCGWFYETWDNYNPMGTRNTYIKRARDLLACGYTSAQIEQVLKIALGR